MRAAPEVARRRPRRRRPIPRPRWRALETRIAALVEEERLKLDPKAKPLAIDPELSRIARARASRHGGKKLSRPCRAQWRHLAPSLLMAEDAKWQGLLGENLAAQHYTKQSGVAVDDFARRFLDEWLKSPPHRDNLAFADYDHAGVGAAVNGDTVYVAVLFSTDMGLPPPKAGRPGQRRHQPRPVRPRPAPPGQSRKPTPLRLRGTEGATTDQRGLTCRLTLSDSTICA